MRWLDNKIEDKIYMIQRIVDLKNIDAESVEKDWWVTAVLKVLFGMSMAKYMYFKGGTSLSKGWNLIDRFRKILISLYIVTSSLRFNIKNALNVRITIK